MTHRSSRYPLVFSSYIERRRKVHILPFLVDASAPCSYNPCEISATGELPHTALRCRATHTALCTDALKQKSSWEGTAATWVSVHSRRAAAPLETTFKEKHKPGLPGWGSALTSSHPAAGLTERQSWSCHDPAGSAEPSLPFCWVLLTCNCTTGQTKDLPKDLARDPSVKTAPTI